MVSEDRFRAGTVVLFVGDAAAYLLASDPPATPPCPVLTSLSVSPDPPRLATPERAKSLDQILCRCVSVRAPKSGKLPWAKKKTPPFTNAAYEPESVRSNFPRQS